MFIELSTQYSENYSDDPVNFPHWKHKGGSTYLLHVDLQAINNAPNRHTFLDSLVQRARLLIEEDNQVCREHLTGWELVEEDHLTWDELDQLQFEGVIRQWSREIHLEEAVPGTLFGRSPEEVVADIASMRA